MKVNKTAHVGKIMTCANTVYFWTSRQNHFQFGPIVVDIVVGDDNLF